MVAAVLSPLLMAAPLAAAAVYGVREPTQEQRQVEVATFQHAHIDIFESPPRLLGSAVRPSCTMCLPLHAQLGWAAVHVGVRLVGLPHWSTCSAGKGSSRIVPPVTHAFAARLGTAHDLLLARHLPFAALPTALSAQCAIQLAVGMWCHQQPGNHPDPCLLSPQTCAVVLYCRSLPSALTQQAGMMPSGAAAAVRMLDWCQKSCQWPAAPASASRSETPAAHHAPAGMATGLRAPHPPGNPWPSVLKLSAHESTRGTR